MGRTSGITWTDATFNPWIGCTKVSAGCANCYAETLMDKRWGKVQWGKGEERQRTSASNWNDPMRWNREAAAAGKRIKVFCASLADVFDEEVEVQWRNDLFDMIAKTPNLDWLLLTKRPEFMRRWVAGEKRPLWPWKNVWLGVSVEDQKTADERIPVLLKTDAEVRWISYEPALGPVDFTMYARHLDWIIVGGESGAGARPFAIEWARDVIQQCRSSGVACFVKQMGSKATVKGKHYVPTFADHKGGDPAEWPEDVRVQEFPR